MARMIRQTIFQVAWCVVFVFVIVFGALLIAMGSLLVKVEDKLCPRPV
jgi:uncharacterized BrkB/YihY/UPF0761 family membrane protein